MIIILQDTIFKVVLWSGKDSPFVTCLDRRATSCKTQYFIFCSGYKPPGLIPLFRNVVNHIFNYNVSSLTLLIQNIQSGQLERDFCASQILKVFKIIYTRHLSLNGFTTLLSSSIMRVISQKMLAAHVIMILHFLFFLYG